VHREYTSAYPAKIIIERDRIVTENWNLPKAPGHIDPNDFEPFPKNPILSRFFIQLSRADVLGSGVRNLYRYTELYSGGTPELIDGDVFRTMVPLNKENFILSDKQPTGEKVTDRVTDEVTDRVTNHEKELINLLIENPKYSFTELSDKLEVSRKTISKRMKLLKERQLIERVGTNKRGYWKVLYK
jgi:ATP-dependent DNA helicase RecG